MTNIELETSSDKDSGNKETIVQRKRFNLELPMELYNHVSVLAKEKGITTTRLIVQSIGLRLDLEERAKNTSVPGLSELDMSIGEKDYKILFM